MISLSVIDLHLCWKFLAFLLLLLVKSYGLNSDGFLLLSLKYSVNDPLQVLQTWNYWDETPCSWNGVSCSPPGLIDEFYRVTGLALPNSQLLGSIPSDLGSIEYLKSLDLSNNSFNGSLPVSLFNASELQFLDLSNNLIAGELPEIVGGMMKNLQLLNLSDNDLAGNVPSKLSILSKLTVVSLKNNYFSGGIPSGFDSVQVLDLSSNLINGSLPLDFGGPTLRYLNVSYNRFSGQISPEFADKIPENATIDFSFNNLTGEIPEKRVFLNQETESFSGNPELCGKPLKNLCPIPSTLSNPPNVTNTTTSPPAIAAIPNINPTFDNATLPESSSSGQNQRQAKTGLRSGTIVGIVIGDLAGVGILGVVFLYLYQMKKKKKNIIKSKMAEKKEADVAGDDWASSSSSSESRGITAWSCLRKRGDDDDESSEETTGSDSEKDQNPNQDQKGKQDQRQIEGHQQKINKVGSLVTVDGGEKELELETLLKASAYILGATGSSIMYKAVLEDGTVLAVRRIGESGVERLRDFETRVRTIGKLVHPNLVRVRGFYWGVDEKLLIYDFVPNGSLANARYRKVGSSPCPLPWEIRLKIAKGVARGLTYLHEKKHVHGNLKPSNILLGSDMEPKIGDFGLERLVTGGETSYKAGGSARNFGSKRSTASRDSFQDLAIGSGPSPSPSPSSLGCISPYHAPESLRSIKPNPKWDVFSFGVVLLELLTGKVIVLDELGQGLGLGAEEKNRVLRMADVAIRADVEGKEEALLACLKLGFSCISSVPQKRPPMKEVLQVLDKLPSSSVHYYGP